MINFLIAVALILFVIILITYLVRLMNEPTYFDDGFEEETVTTTTTTTTTTVVEEPAVVTVDQLPPLKRKFKENGQPFCIDPADNTEWMLNTNDDMYEDASGKWWKLV